MPVDTDIQLNHEDKTPFLSLTLNWGLGTRDCCSGLRFFAVQKMKRLFLQAPDCSSSGTTIQQLVKHLSDLTADRQMVAQQTEHGSNLVSLLVTDVKYGSYELFL